MNAFADGEDIVSVVREKDGVRLVRDRVEHLVYVREVDLRPGYLDRLAAHQAVDSLGVSDGMARVRFASRDDVRAFVSAAGREGVPTFEGLVDPVLRWMVDNHVEPERPRIGWLDIETDSRVSFSRKEEARILSWCVIAGDSERVGVLAEDTDDDERRLLGDFWDAIDDVDLVVAWNGERFDFPVLLSRSRDQGLLSGARDPRRWLWLDHLLTFQRANMMAAESGEEKQSFALDAIARAVLGVGKHDFDASKTWEEWAAGGSRRQRLVDYMVQDTRLMPQIEAKTGYVELLWTLAEACGTFPDTRGNNPQVQVDGFLSRLARDRGHRFPTKFGKVRSTRYKGAYVMEPRTHGIARSVHVADFSSLYPTIIRSWNMSPETYLSRRDLDEATDEKFAYSPLTDDGFRTAESGILPDAVAELMRLRKHWNDLKAKAAPGTDAWKEADRRSTAYKIAANSFYGVVGAPTSRHFNRAVAEAVTQCAAWLIKQTIAEAEKREMQVVYADTDSLFVVGVSRRDFEYFVEWCNDTLYPKLLDEVGARENLINLAYEKAFHCLVLVTAKRYCNPPEAPIWMGDLSFKELGKVRVGDEVVGWEAGSIAARRRLVKTKVVAVSQRVAQIVRVRLTSGRTIRCTADHRWLSYPPRGGQQFYVPPKVGRSLTKVVEQPRVLLGSEQVTAAWLGGQTRVNFVSWCRPAKAGKFEPGILQSRFGSPDKIVSIEPDGEGEVIGLTTETGNYVAWGYASKNCGSYSHYKGTDATADSKPEIKGLEFKRGDSVRLARQLQEEVVYKLVGYKQDASDKPHDFERVLSRWRRKVLLGDLALDDVLISKRLGKPLEDFARKLKKDGAPSRQPAHVRMARELLKRGRDMRQGSKVEFFVSDAQGKHVEVTPAEDWAGECDRKSLWKKYVAPPTVRVLEAAFPGRDWKPWLVPEVERRRRRSEARAFAV